MCRVNLERASANQTNKPKGLATPQNEAN